MSNVQSPQYLLWLCSWYPNKTSLYDGDFIQRHAHATAIYKRVITLSIYEDNNQKYKGGIGVAINEEGSLLEYRVYYNVRKTGIAAVDKLLSMYTYISVGKRMVAKIVAEHGKPELLHAHVILNAGILAKWASEKWRVPYYLSEHWVEYLPEANPNFRNINIWSKRQWHKVVNGAKGISAVSQYLCDCLSTLAPTIKPVRIPNVVNKEVFNLNDVPLYRVGSPIQFLHISTGNYQKNFEGMISAFDKLYDSGAAFVLNVIVPEYAKSKLGDWLQRPYLTLLSERSQLELCHLYKSNDALVLFSRYETFGCVLVEAHACGMPTITSDYAVLQEIIFEDFNGLMARNEDAESLYGALLKYMSTAAKYDKAAISNDALAQFNYARVGQMFVDFYNR